MIPYTIILLNLACAIAACAGFGVVFGVRGKKLLFAALGGGVAILVYDLCAGWVVSAAIRAFLASIGLSVYCEVMARVQKAPVTVYLLVGRLPLVPGSNLYDTMSYCVQGDISKFAQSGLETLAIAGAVALGPLCVASAVRMRQTLLRQRGKLPDC